MDFTKPVVIVGVSHAPVACALEDVAQKKLKETDVAIQTFTIQERPYLGATVLSFPPSGKELRRARRKAERKAGKK